MADLTYIRLEHDATGTGVTIVNGTTNTGMKTLQGSHLGSVVEKPMYSRTIDSLGVHVSGASLDSREQQLTVLFTDTTLAGLRTKVDAMFNVALLINRQGGGTLFYRSGNSTSPALTKFEVSSVIWNDPVDQGEYENFYRCVITFGLVVDPYGLKHDYKITDGFSANTLGTAGVYNPGASDWTVISGPTPAISGGVMTVPNTNLLGITTHTGSGNTFGDLQITAKLTMTILSSAAIMGFVIKYIDATNYLYVKLVDGGATTTMQVRKMVAGVDSAMSSVFSVTLGTRIASGVAQYLRARIEGNSVTCENWTSVPTPGGTPTDTGTSVFISSEATLFGSGVFGQCGIYTHGQAATTLVYDDFEVLPCVYRNWTFPDVVQLSQNWGGTHDARASIAYTATTTIPTWIMYSWWPKPQSHNHVWNGSGEVIGNVTTTAYGWGAGAVTGVTGAATSVARTVTAAKFRSGVAAIEAVCPATANTGVTFPIYRRYRKGVQYTFSSYLHASAGTTTARTRFGVNGDIASTNAVALSTTWTLHTTTWTPTTDREVAYFCAEITAATGTTFQIDDVLVYEGTTAPTYDQGGFGPGIHSAASMDTAKASLSTDGTYWTIAQGDATYRLGTRTRGSGVMTTTANLEYFVDPALFPTDYFAGSEVDVAVMIRAEVASTQTGLACVLSTAPEGGTTFGARKYSELRTNGKSLKLPSAGTVFKPYYLGTITLNVDNVNRCRTKIRLSFTNSGAATGNFGVDEIMLVPIKRTAMSKSSVSATFASAFLGALNATKTIDYDLSGNVSNDAAISPLPVKDDGIGGCKIMMPYSGNVELLVYPSDQILDLTDSSASGQTLAYTGCVRVGARPQVHLLNQ